MRDYILSEIRRLVVARDGRVPGATTFWQETGIRVSEWRGIYWARWGDAVIEAGFEPNVLQGRIDPALALEKLVDAARYYGKIPTKAELQIYRTIDEDTPSQQTYSRRFNGQADMLGELQKWLTGQPGYGDVMAMVLAAQSDARKSGLSGRAMIVDKGVVCLIRSGDLYRIVDQYHDSKAPGRRVEIDLAEEEMLLHSIRTDDPTGIAAYWHQRFAPMQAEGRGLSLPPRILLRSSGGNISKAALFFYRAAKYRAKDRQQDLVIRQDQKGAGEYHQIDGELEITGSDPAIFL